MNLMLNAIEAVTDSGGELTVKSQLQDGQLQFSVSDTGVGLPAVKLDQIGYIIVNLRLHAPAHDPDEGRFASTHGTLLMHPEALAQSLLQNLAGAVLGQIRL